MQGLTDLMNTAHNVDSGAASAAPVKGAHVAGVTLIGATPENLHKLLLTFGFILAAWLISSAAAAERGSSSGPSRA